MGEKISILVSGIVKGTSLSIELNHPTAAGLPKQVHVQSPDLRFELSINDYLSLGLGVLVAGENLKHLKRKK